MTARPHGRSLRTRLLLGTGAVLVVLCAALALAGSYVQRAVLMGDLDDRVTAVARHGLEDAGRRPESGTDLSFLAGSGHPAGLLGGRLGDDGTVTAAAVVREDTPPRPLTAAQRTALHGTTADGARHTVTVPGLGTYRITALDADGTRVLAGLPMDGVRRMTGRLAAAEAVLAAAGLMAAGLVCAVLIRRRLRPLDRVAATAAEVSRAPLERGEAAGLTRVAAEDADPGTETGRVGAALNRMIDHIETSLAERRRGEERMRRFLSDASHELRTPLASIAGYAELMNSGGGRVEPVLAWRRVATESARMTGLVEDLLLLARLDEGRPPEPTEVDLAAVVAEAVRQARPTAPDHHWHLELPLRETVLIPGDVRHLHRAVAGLLANARMHTPPGTTVVAEVEPAGEQCVIRIRDNGPGIPPDLLPGLFDPFTRADPSRSRPSSTTDGAGLGLTVAAAIVTAHGGHIDVHSAPGCTEFRVVLPRVPTPRAGQKPTSASRPSSIGYGTSVTSLSW